MGIEQLVNILSAMYLPPKLLSVNLLLLCCTTALGLHSSAPSGDGFRFECDTTCDSPIENPPSPMWLNPTGGFWTDCSAPCKLVKVTFAPGASTQAPAGGYGPSLGGIRMRQPSAENIEHGFEQFLKQAGGVSGIGAADLSDVASFLHLS